jgi:flagellar assembly factor FliW
MSADPVSNRGAKKMSPAHNLSMAERSAGAPAGPAPEGGELITVETRLGPVAVHPNAVIAMPQGPLGFARHTQFALAELPNPDLSRFKLLQSMDDPSVTFVVAPIEAEGGPISRQDVEDACLNAGMGTKDLLLLLIVTVRNDPMGVTLTANLRAPVIVDVRKRIGRQVVLSNPDYAVRHPL